MKPHTQSHHLIECVKHITLICDIHGDHEKRRSSKSNEGGK